MLHEQPRVTEQPGGNLASRRAQAKRSLFVSKCGCFRKLGVPLAGALRRAARGFGIYIRAPDFWELLYEKIAISGEPTENTGLSNPQKNEDRQWLSKARVQQYELLTTFLVGP